MESTIRKAAAILAFLITAAVAQQFGGYPGGNPFNGLNDPGNSDPNSNSNPNSDPSSGSDGSSSGFNNFQGGNGNDPPFDVNEASRVRMIHGVLAAVAMVALFPTGAVFMRVLPGKVALWTHALMQAAALCVSVAAVGMGIRLVNIVRLPFVEGGSIMSDPNTNYHPIIGLVVVACLLLQPLFGLIHHARFKRVHRRQIWSYMHLFNGRIFVTLGIVNGALGLWQAGASGQVKSAYVGAAGVMWGIWMLVALWGEFRRWRASWRVRRRKFNEGEASF